jgi:transcriptional regulator with XRE-family HTH domain
MVEVEAFKKAQGQLRRRLALNLKAARLRMGLSQEKTAERAGFSLQYFQRIERLMVNVPLDTLTRLALALRTEPADLLAKPRKP